MEKDESNRDGKSVLERKPFFKKTLNFLQACLKKHFGRPHDNLFQLYTYLSRLQKLNKISALEVIILTVSLVFPFLFQSY
jgi:hypothetical protein